MTPEEKLAEKLRRQKLVEESDFELAKETFGMKCFFLLYFNLCAFLYKIRFFWSLGLSGAPRPDSIDDAYPFSKEEFTEFKNNLVKKIQSFSKESCYNDFLEDFVKDLCIGSKNIYKNLIST